MTIIQGEEFSLFWDIDRIKLKVLPFTGRVEWLQKRVEQVLLNPLKVLEKAETNAFVWLATTELVCAGIESLAGFYGDGRHGPDPHPNLRPFCRFVYKFMSSNFALRAQSANGESWTYCQHLQEYFRGGLDHGFAIEWGGLWHDGEDGTRGYLRPASDGKGIAIDPRKLLTDFCQAVDGYFSKLLREGENSITGENFQNRFNRILEHRSRIR
jgi:hypothetical protein